MPQESIGTLTFGLTPKPGGLARITSWARRTVRRIPRGWTLEDDTWQSRHRGILVILWTHVAIVPVFGLLRGVNARHVALEAAGIAMLGIFATTKQLNRRARTVFASIGLMSASAVLVHLGGGAIEMHFHFFVMVPLVALYQDWVPFSIAIGYVALHHGVVGTIDPESVFNHPAAFNQPWKWAAIHAFFITGISAACLVTWGLLESALHRAKREAQVKSEFLSVLSHEIRTPLTSVIGYTGLLADGELTDEQRDCADVIKRSSDHLLTLINDILDYSKLEAGRLELDASPFDVLHLMDDTISLIADSAEQRGLQLSSLCENSVPRNVVGDSGRVAQVLLNLVSNAVKFTEQGEVLVRVSGRPVGGGRNEITIAVRDTGIGINDEALNRLFKSFTQAEASTSRKYGGTGLGLAIAKQLCELMGGTISVTSQPGVGSTFSASFIVSEGTGTAKRHEANSTKLKVLVIGELRPEIMEYLLHFDITPRVANTPEALVWVRSGQQFDLVVVADAGEVSPRDLAIELRALHATRRPHLALISDKISAKRFSGEFDTVLAHPVRQSHVYDMLVAVTVGDDPTPQPVDRDAPKLAEIHPLRILIAEDNHINQKMLVSQLNNLGYAVDAVSSGAEAIQAAGLRSYDLILMDLHMPEIDGVTATRRIRQELGDDSPAIVAITADSTAEARAACRTVGMFGYITKPVKAAELEAALRDVAKHKGAA